jgi:hypothetical protein
MCITLNEAELYATIVGGWDIVHPERGPLRVLAYLNNAKNLVPGLPNCMPLQVETDTDLTPEDIIDTTPHPTVLKDMFDIYHPKTRSLRKEIEEVFVVEMGIYHLVVMNSLSQEGLAKALAQVPENKRPHFSEKMLSFYKENLPNCKLILACFDTTEAKNASTILVTYIPSNPDKIRLPMLEGHGSFPVIAAPVEVHQKIVVGFPEELPFNRYDGLRPLDDTALRNSPLREWLPNYVATYYETQKCWNFDWMFPLKETSEMTQELNFWFDTELSQEDLPPLT